VEGGFLLNVIVGESSAVFQLLASKDQSLLIGWDSFFVLDLSFDVVDCVRGLDIECNSLSCEGLYEDLHFSLFY